MLSRCLKASRPVYVTLSRQQVSTTWRRTLFVPSAIRSADLVQDLYLRELKNYKPTPIKPNDSDGHVQKFNVPKAPESPEESDIGKELNAYESQAVEIEGQAAPGDGQSAVEQDWFEEEEEEPQAAH